MATGFPLHYVLLALVALVGGRWLGLQIVRSHQRRAMSREYGCKPPRYFLHKGILGKLIGLDMIKQNLRSGNEGRFHETMRENVFEDSHTVAFHQLHQSIITTIEPENVKTVLSTKFQDYCLGMPRSRTLEPTLGHGIFTSDGKDWERSRAMIRPNFTRQQVADLNVFEHHIQNLIRHVPRDGSTVDLQDLFFKLSMDSATEFLFGRSTNTLAPGIDSHDAERFVEAFVYNTDRMVKMFRTAGLMRWVPDAKYSESINVIHKFADDIIHEAISQQQDIVKQSLFAEQKQYTFLYELLKQTQDPTTLRSELLNVLLAGRDTTASLLSHTFWILARRQDVWNKLRAEIEELEGEIPDYERIKSMKYVKWVLNESLRLYPVVPANGREAVRDTVLPLGGGPDGKSPVYVPKGTRVTYSVWSMHRRKDYFGADALEFKPERWETLRPGWEYLPFNGGPRICIGQQFALLEASYTLVRLMQHFTRIEARDERPWSEFQTLTLAVGPGVKVALYEK